MLQGFQVGEWQVQPDLGTLTRGEEQVQVEPKAMAVLVYLAEHAGELVPKERLMRAVWPDTFVGDDVLAHAISMLRRAFGEDATNSSHIRTLPRRGYQLIADVQFAGGGKDHSPGPSPKLWLALTISAALAFFAAVVVLMWWLPLTDLGQIRTATLRAVPFTTLAGGESSPDFSPEGDRIAFQWRGPDSNSLKRDSIYVKQIGPGDPLRLTSSGGHDFFPRWSPSGQEIVFARNQGDRIALITVPSLGGRERTLVEIFPEPEWDNGVEGLSWAPRGEQLAVSYRPAGETRARVFLLDVNSGRMQPVTFPPDGTLGDYSGQFSPDGQRIAFFRRKSPINWDLYVVRLPEGDERRLTSENLENTRGLTWTPDGKEIVYSAGTWPTMQLWRVAISGDGQPEPLLGFGEYLGRLHPALSKRGRRLAYTALMPSQTSIWEFGNPGASELEIGARHLIASTRNDIGPAFSPNGDRIAFQSDRTGQTQIYVCDRDGSQVRKLAETEAFSGAPAWSPDGRQICFNMFAGNADIYIVNAEGGTPQQVTTDPAEDLTPSWSRDGHWIYFASNRTGIFQTWKKPVGGGEAVQVTREGGSFARESLGAEEIYYLKKNPGELWKICKETGEETPVLRSELYWWDWSLTSEGVYYINRKPWVGRNRLKVSYLDFRTGLIRDVLDWKGIGAPRGLAVSPEQRWILCSLGTPSQGSDIMLVENFR